MIYLDNAATTWPKPREVINAMTKTMYKYGANPGRSGHKMSVTAGRIVLYARELLCELFHIDDPFRFVFCSNCTDALNLAIKGVLEPGDHVITTTLEHNSVLRPLKTLEQRGQIKVTILPVGQQGYTTPEAVEQSILPETKLVVVNHISNVTGTIQPIRAIGEICKKHHILFLVDGAQSAGIIPMDLSSFPLDLYAFPGHKGLYGPQGTGGLYIRDGLVLHTLKEGGTGSSSESWYQPDEVPERYESGTLNTPGIAGLAAGIRFVLRNQKEIMQKERELTKALLEELSQMKKIHIYGSSTLKQRTGVISFNIEDKQSGWVADYLDREYNIACRAGLHCAPLIHKAQGTLEQGAVRLSIGYFNTMEEIKTCAVAIKKICEK